LKREFHDNIKHHNPRYVSVESGIIERDRSRRKKIGGPDRIEPNRRPGGSSPVTFWSGRVKSRNIRKNASSEIDSAANEMGEEPVRQRSSSEPAFQIAIGREASTGRGPGRTASAIKSLDFQPDSIDEELFDVISGFEALTVSARHTKY
jgi:hypothetical protein